MIASFTAFSKPEASCRPEFPASAAPRFCYCTAYQADDINGTQFPQN